MSQKDPTPKADEATPDEVASDAFPPVGDESVPEGTTPNGGGK